MPFYADLHVHSKYSRATSRDCDLEHLAWWAARKGLGVIATGDFTHPAWFDELRSKLVPAEPGLFRLQPEIEREVASRLPAACRTAVRFLLEVEISTIYKQGEKTRKVHHLIYAASFDTAARLRERLGAIGNLGSDGRPILGLPSRHLLEIVLESGPDAYLVPAHVWTPWFSTLGSKSGFDSVEECYGDLAAHIFAVETGLSSDPPMNDRVSRLDRFTLVSSSDAHSPPMLGREASVFATELDYFAIRRALETGEGYGGTIEFFPEEGKYHLDGHRACGVSLEPAETRRQGGRCPQCGKPVTVGVLHRVEELADRPEGAAGRARPAFRSLVPLAEVLGEIHGVGPRSRAVEESASRLAERLGGELDLLDRVPLEEVARAADPRLPEALARLRAGRVQRTGGYDGEYGVIRLFAPGELAARSFVGQLPTARRPAPADEPPPSRPAVVLPAPGAPPPASPLSGGQLSLLAPPAPAAPLAPASAASAPSAPAVAAPTPAALPGGPSLLDGLDPEQRAAAEIVAGPLLILAGPGTGKTRTLTHRLAHLIAERGVAPERCLAVTFSRRAAAELGERLAALLGSAAELVRVATFHGLGLALLQDLLGPEGQGLRVADATARLELVHELFGLAGEPAERWLADLGRWRRGQGPASAELGEQAERYARALAERRLLDLDDLLVRPVALLDERPELVTRLRRRFEHVAIDEYQDVDLLQYRLIRHLVPPAGNLCAIGDPDQSIYRFRGAEVGFFLRFREDFPTARLVELGRNYRSSATIVAAASQAIRPASLAPDRRLHAQRAGTAARVVVHRAASERAEAEMVAQTIEELLGGTSHFALDSGRATGSEAGLSFGDFAVLYRTEAQADPLLEALGRSGIPVQKRSHRPLGEHAGVRALTAALAAAEPVPGSVEALLAAKAAQLAGEGEGTAAQRSVLLAAVSLLRPLASRAGDDLPHFLADLALGEEIDTWDPRAERVSLLTLHAAKGLEFEVVFLVGCEDGLLPLVFPGDEAKTDLAEERRLFFVGMTRARSYLYLSHARKRTRWGRSRLAQPSPFLADLAEGLLDRREETADGERVPQQLRLL